MFWPTKPEFVRMAAKHSATVVPVSAIGWEDCFSLLADTDELRNSDGWVGAHSGSSLGLFVWFDTMLLPRAEAVTPA